MHLALTRPEPAGHEAPSALWGPQSQAQVAVKRIDVAVALDRGLRGGMCGSCEPGLSTQAC